MIKIRCIVGRGLPSRGSNYISIKIESHSNYTRTNLPFLPPFFSLFLWVRVSLYTFDCPGIHYVEQPGLELTDQPASASQGQKWAEGKGVCLYTWSFLLDLHKKDALGTLTQEACCQSHFLLN